MMSSVPGHHYHYPNLDSTVGNSTLGRPSHHLIRVGSSGRLRLAQHMIDPRLVPPSTAALIDPVILAPYDNGSQTYHRGFGTCAPGGQILLPVGITVSGGSAVGPNGASVSFYESGGSIQPSDPSVAYRGSVLSSTTVSSNHEELMQAYEYGRKHHLRSCLTLPSNAALPHPPVPMNFGARLIPAHMNMGLNHTNTNTNTGVPHHPALIDTTEVGDGEVSGGSASSDATDSGIRQFTQQPPQPDEARHAACEVPLIYDGNLV
ncbi:unnamed protein product [Trichobilharzia regenti]|nr:unnamed protein product [Trichobilharzia regenti]